MPAPSPTRHNAVILLVLLALQLVLMSGSAKQTSGASMLETWVMRLSSPFVELARKAAGAVSGLTGGVGDLIVAHRRNAELEAELERLSDELVRHRESEPENRRLRRLLGMRQELAPRSIAATIVTANLSRQTRMIVIDRGLNDGVRRDMPVVAWGGAVGRVVAVESEHAKVRLLNDTNSGVAGVVQRSRAQGMVLGRSGGALALLYVPRFSDVMHGDRVVTSGLDGIFPRGFGIGRVGDIEADANGAQTIHLEPELSYRALEEVLVLLDSGTPDPASDLTGQPDS